MPRMRTIHEAAKHIKATDPATALTETAIRRLVVTGELPSVRIGTKFLLDVDILDAFLSRGSGKGLGKPDA